MVEGAGNKCAKYLLFAFNLLFVLAALALIVVGALALPKSDSFTDILFKAGIFLIIIGGIAFIVSFFGCCGAIKENRCMLITFAVLLVVILLLCLAATIFGFMYRHKAKETANDILLSYIKEYNATVDNPAKNAIDKFQKDHACCGSYNYTAWKNNEFFYSTKSLPDSCCMNETSKCGKDGLIRPENMNTEGCVSALQNLLEKGCLIVGAVAAAVALIMILGVVFSCCLASAVHGGYNTV